MPHVWICLIQLPNKHNSAVNAIYSRDLLLQMYIANVYLQVLLQMYIANIYIYILQINWIFSA